MKAERVSYEVMTPSAARGIFDAILWKPAIRWVIERIHVLRPIRFRAIRRNEVNKKAPTTRGDLSNYYASEDRAQRNTILLTDVDYIVEAHFEMTARAAEGDTIVKFEEMFARRLAKGQAFHQPYLGCREHAARFEPAPDTWTVDESLRHLRPLGMMLHDLDFAPDGSGSATPRFFAAVLDHGVLEVPELPR
jgi:CRISPR-associated protein Cas5d